ncbi:fumarylacetoacetate hydrolase family protein [Actinomadura geliboluensis]|uniref:fumarylacetoacetate hydrolase family protein n=1 Tax=Actinomadura geliboluensis TaxID=882440 RepID=UPI0037223887
MNASAPGPRVLRADLRAPVPAPRQVFAIGLKYHAHAAESGLAVPEQPVVFTKFPTCITGPYDDITLPDGGHTDWEVELVATADPANHHSEGTEPPEAVTGRRPSRRSVR